jgi:hypothetical protein
MVAFYGNPRLESGETPISGKVRKDEQLAYLERSPARDRATEVSSPLGDQPPPILREDKL